jgi:hypothetical protein
LCSDSSSDTCGVRSEDSKEIAWYQGLWRILSKYWSVFYVPSDYGLGEFLC